MRICRLPHFYKSFLACLLVSLPLATTLRAELLLNKEFMTALSVRPNYWPKKVTLMKAVTLTKADGTTVALAAGTEVEIKTITSQGVEIQSEGASKLVLPAQTDLAVRLPAEKARVEAEAAAAKAATTTGAATSDSSSLAKKEPVISGQPPTPFLASAGKDLVERSGNKLVSHKSEVIDGADYIAVYYSAGWCGPCRAFTPELVKFYKSARRKGYKNFEVVFVSSDKSEEGMVDYIKEEKMPWPSLEFDKSRESPLSKFRGKGIPCLVLLDRDGNVVKHSYEDGKYVGPTQVMDALEEALEKKPAS